MRGTAYYLLRGDLLRSLVGSGSCRDRLRGGGRRLDEGFAGTLHLHQGDGLALEEDGQGPGGEHAHLAVHRGDPAAVVQAVEPPGRTALQLVLAEEDRHTLVEAQAGHRAEVLVLVLLLREAPHAGDDVVAEDDRLADRVLGVRGAPGALAHG